MLPERRRSRALAERGVTHSAECGYARIAAVYEKGAAEAAAARANSETQRLDDEIRADEARSDSARISTISNIWSIYR